MATISDQEAARKLTEFLTERSAYGDRVSVIESRVRVGITALTAEIANEIIRENPELRSAIRSRVTAVIEKALRDDAYLNAMVTKAIAEALTRHSLGTDDD